MYEHIFSLEPHFINIKVPNKPESNINLVHMHLDL